MDFLSARLLKTWVGLMGLIALLAGCKTSAPLASQTKSDLAQTPVKITPEFFPIPGPTDAIYRNRRITQHYYFGGEALRKILNQNQEAGNFNANWLHFGIWGSMRAGESIDGTDLQFAMTAKDFMFDYVEQSLAWLPVSIRGPYIENIKKDRELIATINKIVQQALAGGNQRVADEIMGITDRYIKTLGCESVYDDARLQSFLNTFEYSLEKDAPFSKIWEKLLAEIPLLMKGKRHEYGQDALALAYATYHKSRFEENQLIRAQMIHYANLLIAIHEQLVLQTYISGAIGILDPASSIYRKIVTILAMDIGLPEPGFNGVSRMGEGLRRYPLRNSLSPTNFDLNLRDYQWPPLVELARVTGLDRFSGRGATDWQDYRTRVYFIGGLMRTMHSNPMVSSFPFSGPHEDVTASCNKPLNFD